MDMTISLGKALGSFRETDERQDFAEHYGAIVEMTY
jgi:hypothetical protein